MRIELQPETGSRIRSMELRQRAMEMDVMTSPRKTDMMQPESNLRRTAALLVCALGPVVALAGCGALGNVSGSGTGVTGFKISGNVHGGQQPVSGATIQLYTVGTTGLQSASTAMVTSTTVTTDVYGGFVITGDYSCSTVPATQVYITATGGNPGAGTNTALSLAAALGPCSALTPSTFIQMNEITTIAAAYALAPFAADITHIGATGSNPTGLVNAFSNAGVISNFATGTVGGNLGAGVSLPTAEINSLADIIASCVNTNGATSPTCTTLFAATGASDTFGAALAIAKNPGSSAITALYTLATPSAPFQPTLTATPNDFTVAVTSTANGSLATPYGIAIDASGNAWVTNEGGNSVSELAVNGSSLGNTSAANLYGAQAVAIDRTGNVWAAATTANAIDKLTISAGAVTNTTAYTAGGLSGPVALAIDSGGNVFAANLASNSVTGLNSGGGALSGSPFQGFTFPTGIAVSPGGNVYVASGSGSVVKLSGAGAQLATLNDGTLQGSAGIAVDPSGRILAAGFTTGGAVGGALSQFAASGTAAANSPVTLGLTFPGGVASDGTSIWVANGGLNGGLAQFTYGSSTPISPANGYGPLNGAVGVAIDASGSVWTTNSGANTVSKFIGLAAPVATPLAVNVGP
jgi:streptogramin lyase